MGHFIVMFNLVAITIGLKSLKKSVKFGRIYCALYPKNCLKLANIAVIISILNHAQMQSDHESNQGLVKLLRFVTLQNPYSQKQIP